jgi:arylsulfatase A-like enzyme
VSAPNVLFLAVDSLRADAVFGDHVETPRFDAYSRAGSAFTQCVCTTTTTTPSFSSMLTGCYPPRHGVRGLQGYRLSSALPTLAEAFKGAGYNTYAEVTGPLLPETGVLRGFDHAHHRPAYKVPFFGWREEVCERMRAQVEPWFMLLHIWEVHRPYRSPPDFTKRKDKAGYEAAVHATDEWLGPVYEAAGDNTIVVITGDHGEEYPKTPLQFQLLRVARKARRVLKLSKWLPLADQRIAAMEIGHGFALHEHLVRVPLIISGPGISSARISDQVRHVDLFPTLADLCGLEPPPVRDGRSLRGGMDGNRLEEAPAYMEAVGVKLEGDRIIGIRTPAWKLLRKRDGRQYLYRLDGPGGPDESRNLASEHPDVVQRLGAVLEEVAASEVVAESGMTTEEEATVEQHLRDLGYL